MVRARLKSAKIERNVSSYTSNLQKSLRILPFFLNILSNEISFRLVAENEKLNTIVTSLRTKYKSIMTENDDAIRKLAQEKVVAAKKNKDMVKLFQNFIWISLKFKLK